MNPIQVTVTGRLGDDPRAFQTRDGGDGVELRLAVEVPARGAGDSVTRWIKVTAFGVLATRTAESVRKGDRVIVTADDMIAEVWLATGNGEPRSRITLRARDIAASMAFDNLRTGYAARAFASRPLIRSRAMNSQPPPRVQVRTLDSLIAVVPYLLGFHPERSLVVLAITRPNGRIQLAFRFDLPDPPDHELTAAIVGHSAALVSRQQLTDAVIIGYGPGALVNPIADLARQVTCGGSAG